MIIVSNAHAYQAVTALFTATGPRAAAAIKEFGLHANSSFSIQRTSNGDFTYTDERGKDYARFTINVAKDGTATIATINNQLLPEEA